MGKINRCQLKTFDLHEDLGGLKHNQKTALHTKQDTENTNMTLEQLQKACKKVKKESKRKKQLIEWRVLEK